MNFISAENHIIKSVSILKQSIEHKIKETPTNPRHP